MKLFKIQTSMAGSWVGEYESKEAAETAAWNADCSFGNGCPSYTVEEVEEVEEQEK